MLKSAADSEYSPKMILREHESVPGMILHISNHGRKLIARLRSRLIVGLMHLLAWLPLPVLRGLGNLLGALGWRLGRKMVAVTRRNIDLCFPELEPARREALARDSVRETFRAIIEMPAVWLWPADRIIGRIHQVHGMDKLRQAHAQGKGVIVISPHLGNWELMGLYLNTCGCGPSSQLYQAPSDPLLDRLLFKARSRSGAKMVNTDTKGVAVLLSYLRRGEVVGILPDQVPPASGGIFAPFFGVDALTMTLVSRLLAKTGARIVLTVAKRVDQPRAGFEVHILDFPEDIYSEDLLTSVSALNRGIENAIRLMPAQYHWEYKRFKRQPDGKPNLYL